MIWQAQRRASPAPAAGAAEAAAVKELRALMVGGQKCQHNPKGQGPKPKEVARQHKRSLCQPHSTSGMAKKMKMKTLLGAGCEGWEVGKKQQINDRCHKMAMHALKRAIHALTRAIHALTRAMGFGLQALKRAVASNPFF
jgi:hypothetical protein